MARVCLDNPAKPEVSSSTKSGKIVMSELGLFVLFLAVIMFSLSYVCVLHQSYSAKWEYVKPYSNIIFTHNHTRAEHVEH